MIHEPKVRLDSTLSALADPIRREILVLLAPGETRVTDVARHFPCSLNAVSKHLKILEQAGLVGRRRTGREHWIRFQPGPLGEVAAWVSDRRAFWTSELTGLAQQLSSESVSDGSP
jgi:DNA-binding transcriptional ArsR family regulator